MKLILCMLVVLTLAGCSAVTGALPGENFSRAGSCGTVNTFGEVKQWGCFGGGK